MTKQRKQINEILAKFNIPESFKIETEAESMILNVLRDPDFDYAYIDKEGFLCFEFKEDENEQRTI